MQLELIVNKNRINGRPKYKELYHAANNRLTDIGRMVIVAQQELEELYLKQTDPVNLPVHLDVAK